MSLHAPMSVIRKIDEAVNYAKHHSGDKAADDLEDSDTQDLATLENDNTRPQVL